MGCSEAQLEPGDVGLAMKHPLHGAVIVNFVR